MSQFFRLQPVLQAEGNFMEVNEKTQPAFLDEKLMCAKLRYLVRCFHNVCTVIKRQI